MSTYPGTIDTFNVIGTTNYFDESGYVLHEQLNTHGSAVNKIETVLGTTAGTSVLKDFTAGEFAVARNAGGTVTDTLTKGTANNFTLGTPTITGGTIASPIINGTGGTVAGQHGYDGTDKALFIGDGAVKQSIFTSGWKSFTPAVTGAVSDIGDATFACTYCQIGKHVSARYAITFGSSTSFTTGSMVVALPVTASSGYIANGGAIGVATLVTPAYYPAIAYLNNTTTMIFVIPTISTHTGTVYAIQTTASNLIPGTWANGHIIMATITYEAA